MQMAMFRVKELAKAQGLNQVELSNKSGVQLSTVQRIWQNNRAGNPNSETLRLLAGALGVTIEELYVREVDQASSSAPRPEAVNKTGIMVPA
jgi:transcriptional regulator with XRE-family HTH domain